MSKTGSIAGVATAFGLGMAMMWALDRGGSSAAATAAGPEASSGAIAVVEGPRQVNEGAARVDLYVMSQCPYGVEAEKAFKPVVADLGADLDLRIEYIGSSGPDGELGSLHGQPEVMGNIAQLCAMKYSPKWFEFIECQNENWKAVDSNWDACGKRLGVPADKLAACVGGEEGKGLLRESYARAEKAKANGSPTIHIGGKDYEGSRKPADLMRAICNEYQGNKPAACTNIPELPKVNVTLLGDKRCGEDCDLDQLSKQVRRVIGNPVITQVDYGSEEGKKLFAEIKPIELPALVFDETLAQDVEAAMKIVQGSREVGKKRVLSAGEWSPACVDKDGCKLDECKNKLMCRAEEPNKLEVFVMSQCPYGVKGLDAMKAVLDNFKEARAAAKDKKVPELTFQVHFVGNEEEGKLTSLHGQPEVDENIREACAAQHYPKDYKFMDYVWCRNKDIMSESWEGCASADKGFDVAVIKKCFEGEEGKKLMSASFAHADKLGFSASPTWLVNGKYQFSGIDAETIKKNVCAHNKLPGCEKDLTAALPDPGGAAPQGASCD